MDRRYTVFPYIAMDDSIGGAIGRRGEEKEYRPADLYERRGDNGAIAAGIRDFG